MVNNVAEITATMITFWSAFQIFKTGADFRREAAGGSGGSKKFSLIVILNSTLNVVKFTSNIYRIKWIRFRAQFESLLSMPLDVVAVELYKHIKLISPGRSQPFIGEEK
jgi:hypothetical protein